MLKQKWPFWKQLACGFLGFILLAFMPLSYASSNLSTQLGHYQSLSGHFQQSLYSSRGDLIQKSKGDFALKRPSSFLWAIKQPNVQTLIAQGQTLYVYDEDLAQITYTQVSKQNSQETPVWLLTADSTALNQHYRIQVLKSTSGGSAYRLYPKQASPNFQWVEIYFSQSGGLSRIKMKDNIGQLSDIQFFQVKMNTTLSPQLFKMIEPKGVDIIHE